VLDVAAKTLPQMREGVPQTVYQQMVWIEAFLGGEAPFAAVKHPHP
jgi:hypothetical protein